MLDLKEWKHLKLTTRTKVKMFFHFYLLILWLPNVFPVNTYPLLYETASLTNILFFVTMTNNDTNKVPALAVNSSRPNPG